jgi:hypothetical protein
MMANQKHSAAVRPYLLHSSLQVQSQNNVRNHAEPKPFSWAKLAYFGFSSSNFTVQDHIPSSAGDALRTPQHELQIFTNDTEENKAHSNVSDISTTTYQ